jgi:hypothetical protein
VFEYIMQSLANYRSMHMRMQQLAQEGALEGAEPEGAHKDRTAAGARARPGPASTPGLGLACLLLLARSDRSRSPAALLLQE